jgi:hypothetical protein
MANQAIALQARAPQGNFLAPVMQQAGQMINQMAQQKAAERQAATAEQALKVSQAGEARAAAKAPFELAEATEKALTAQQKNTLGFYDLVAAGVKNSSTPDQVLVIANFLKETYPGATKQIDQKLSDMPADPAAFDAWREKTMLQSLDAKDQLTNEYITQNTGAEQRVAAVSKYGGGPATEVPGSRFQSAQDITYVRGEDGSIRAMPKNMPGTGGFGAPAPAAPAAGLVGGARGGSTPVAIALQTNPGAIRNGPFTRSQPGYAGASGGFATFDTPQAGIAAQENLLRKDYVGKGINTVNKIIDKYTPASKENPEAGRNNYKTYVAGKLGIDLNTPITAAQVPVLAAAMRDIETGNRSGSAPAPRGGAGGLQFGQVVPGMEGSGKKDGKTTESERRFGTIAKQMRSNLEEATNILTTNPEVIKPSGTEYAAKQIPFYGEEASMFAQSEARQQFVPAVLRFLDNITFVNTGAGTSKAQEENYRRSYVPTYQDTPASAHRKLANMITFAKNVKDAAGSLWTPDMDASFKTLEQAVAKLKPTAKPAATPTAPKIGAVAEGHRFKGGDPANPKNWEKVR